MQSVNGEEYKWAWKNVIWKMIQRQESARICGDEKKNPIDLSIRSWLGSTQVGRSLDVKLLLFLNRLEFGLINMISGGI